MKHMTALNIHSVSHFVSGRFIVNLEECPNKVNNFEDNFASNVSTKQNQ
jgi:hypothetical protein